MIRLVLASVLATQSPTPPAAPGSGEAAAPPPVRPYEMPESVAAGLSGWSPPREGALTPVTVESYARSYEGPRDPLDQRFLIGLESARLAMDSRMGPLDGAWVVEDAGGAPLLALILTDPAPSGAIEGAWADLTGPVGARPSGVIGAVTREDGALSVSFLAPGDADPVRLRLRPDGDGWRGRLIRPGGPVRTVVMRRR